MVRREMLLARLWYFCYSGSQVFFFPYISLFLQQLGWQPWSVGLVQGLRPWVSAPCSLLLCSLADRFRIHRAVLISCFLLSVALRGALALFHGGSVAAVAGLLLLAEAAGSPVGVIADATVVAQCTDPSDYGKQRVWASIGWGGLSVAAGALIRQTSVQAGMLAYILLSMPCSAFAWLMSKQADAAGACSAPLDDAADNGGCKDTAQQRGVESVPGAAATPRAAAADDSTPLPPAWPTAAQPPCSNGSAPAPAPAPRLALPLQLPRLGRRGAADEDLRTRLLAAAARTPSPCPPSPAPSSIPGRGAGLACLAAPLFDHGIGDAGPAANSDSCCSSPRSTAALLDPPDRAPSPLPFLPAPRLGERAAEAVEGRGKVVESDEGDGGGLGGAAAAAVPQVQADLLAGMRDGRAHVPLALEGLAGAAVEGDNGPVDAAAPAGGGGSAGDGMVQVSLQAARGESRKSLLGAGVVSDAVVAPVAPAATASEARATRGGGGRAAELLALLSSGQTVTFLLRALVIGFGLGVQGTFASLLVLNLGGSELLIGLMLLFSILTEAPAFQFQSALLSRVPVTVVVDASTVLLAVRLGCYALLPRAPSAWAVLPIELLHGVTFATSWGAGIVTCKRLAPAHLNATMQSVFAALYGGVGSGLGAIVGGVLMSRHGAPTMFAICAAIVLGGWAAACAADFALRLGYGAETGTPGVGQAPEHSDGK